MTRLHEIRVIDSHTAGEPTRLVVEGGPDLGGGPLDQRVQRFRQHFDHYRSAIVNEPRGSDAVVGALLTPPGRADCQLGVIFFNNVGYLGMCGHGTIGLIASLAHMGRLRPGSWRVDTPVGPVSTRLNADGSVEVENVVSYRKARDVVVQLAGGSIHGDVAWGGNWFFLTDAHDLTLTLPNVEALTQYAWQVRQALNAQGHPEVDHVELFSSGSAAAGSDAGVAPVEPAARPRSRNFVLCSGKAYDRSPCGTGTSAKLACLAADGKLAEGEEWLQEGLIGTSFTAHYRWKSREKGEIIPTITGRAFVTGEALLRLDERDPFCFGIRSDQSVGR
ncbi:MAG: proline racemase family protein [Proteobacteria bacterium]|nr:proline racemase family protein [Pseudomonadota bacterium]